MVTQIIKRAFILISVLLPIAFTLPNPSLPEAASVPEPTLERRDEQFKTIILQHDGNPMAVNLWADARCGRSANNQLNLVIHKNIKQEVKPVAYGINYSLQEQPTYDHSQNGYFNSYSVSRDLMNNEQMDISTYIGTGNVVTDPADPGCSLWVGSAAGNTSVNVVADQCYAITGACFRIWLY